MGAVASHSHILSKHQQKNINMHENAVNHDDPDELLRYLFG